MAQGTRSRTVVIEVNERAVSVKEGHWVDLRDPDGHLFARYNPTNMCLHVIKRLDGERRAMIFPLWQYH